MKKYEYSDEIAAVVKKFLEEDDWRYSFHEDTGLFHFSLKISSVICRINYVIDVHEAAIITYGLSPVAVPQDDPEIMSRMAEFLCRVNYTLENGCFEMDCDDGEIRYRIYIDCDKRLPSTDIVMNSVYCTAAMFKRYAAGITGIISGGESARDAFADEG